MTVQGEYERGLDRFLLYLVERGYGVSTLQSYPQAVRSLMAFFERTSNLPTLREITVQDLREFAIYRLRSRRGSTVTAYMIGLRRFFTFLEQKGIIDASPARNISLPKAHPTPTRPLQESEIKRLLRACSGDGFTDERDMALFRVFMATGARRSEVVGLTIDPRNYTHGDLDLVEGVAKLRDKTGRTRRCALDPRTVRSLRRYLRIRAKHAKNELPNLWITNHGGLTASGIHNLAMARATKAGVVGFRLHRIRVTFAHRWLLAGGNPGDLMRILGLRSRKMIDGYADGVAGSRSVQAARGHFVDHRF